MKGTVNGVTTTYIGNHFEWSGSTTTAKKYYYAGTTRVAMREGSTLYYLLSDHLGSTAVTADASGNKVSETRFMPFGADRYVSGTSHTTYRYTGQRNEGYINLYWYNSRWYDPKLGRFISADTVIPESQGVQAWDRYAGMNNNPLRYTDPTGHEVCTSDGQCGDISDESSSSSDEDDGDYVTITLGYEALQALARQVERDAWLFVAGVGVVTVSGVVLAAVTGPCAIFYEIIAAVGVAEMGAEAINLANIANSLSQATTVMSSSDLITITFDGDYMTWTTTSGVPGSVYVPMPGASDLLYKTYLASNSTIFNTYLPTVTRNGVGK